jgi:hypothetical protein
MYKQGEIVLIPFPFSDLTKVFELAPPLTQTSLVDVFDDDDMKGGHLKAIESITQSYMILVI